MKLDTVLLVLQVPFVLAVLVAVIHQRGHPNRSLALWKWPEFWLLLSAGSMTLRAQVTGDPFIPLAYLASVGAVFIFVLRFAKAR